MGERLKKLCLQSAAILGVGCAYAMFCRLTGFGIPCPFHLITGLNCPGCGVSRMLLCLMEGDLNAAFGHNAVLLCLLPVLAALFLVRAGRYLRRGSWIPGRFGRGVELGLVGVLLLWGAVRNFIGM